MLQVNQVSKSFGVQTVLDRVSFIVNTGERVGLVGENGSGKTTLLRIIARLEQPDAGHVTFAPHASLGYLPQGAEEAFGATVGAVIRSGRRGWEEARRAVEQIAAQMTHARGDALTKLMSEYDEATARFDALGGYAGELRVEVVLSGLALNDIPLDTPVARLSGGQHTRLNLARLLLAEPTVLLLDEPTNHLDIHALEWLEDFLNAYRGAALIVSHDRTFLDRTVTTILELDATTHALTKFAGNYSAYEEAKARSIEKQWAAWKDQQAEIRRIEQDIARTKEQARHTEEATKNDHLRRLSKKVALKAKAREHRLQRMLDSTEMIEPPQLGFQMKLEFGAMPRGGQSVLTLAGLGHAFGERWLFRHANLTLRHGERIALVGPNGAGKTTLLRIIAGELTPTEGSVRVGANVRLGYMSQEQNEIDAETTPFDLMRGLAPFDETEARRFLHLFLFAGDKVFARVKSLSYGERARLLLARLVVRGANCLVLDEPINHLDIPSRERFQAALDAFPGTVLVAVHDRKFIERFASGIWSLEAGTLQRID